MAIAGLVLAAVAIVVAIVIPFVIERLKRPSLEIAAGEWRTPAPLSRTFAVVRVRNKSVAAPFSKSLTREVAQGCVVEIDFCRGADRERVFPTLRGRWSSHPQPISLVPSRAVTPYTGPSASVAPAPYAGGTISPDIYTGVTTGDVVPDSGGTVSTFSYPGGRSPAPYAGGTTPVRMNYTNSFDPTLDPPQQDVGASQEGEEVAVAILRDGKAFAFSAESYAYSEFGKPDWELTRGTTYYIIVRVRGYNAEGQEEFKLEYLDDNFANFRLQASRKLG